MGEFAEMAVRVGPAFRRGRQCLSCKAKPLSGHDILDQFNPMIPCHSSEHAELHDSLDPAIHHQVGVDLIDPFRQFGCGRVSSVDANSKRPRQPARRGKIVGVEKHLLKLILDAASCRRIVPDLAESDDQLGDGVAEPVPSGSQLRRRRQASRHKAIDDHPGDLIRPLASCRERAQGLLVDRAQT
ncbi:hypothetical protein [Mesorhizobium caraganae]|uniref:hypothetical protein n=1 Tax=Mesorhizobium caraganae TaxID=483206 RepID=UPI001FED3CE9|nr:hypothetical protein [Mesorhizobium caraganae]